MNTRSRGASSTDRRSIADRQIIDDVRASRIIVTNGDILKNLSKAVNKARNNATTQAEYESILLPVPTRGATEIRQSFITLNNITINRARNNRGIDLNQIARDTYAQPAQTVLTAPQPVYIIPDEVIPEPATSNNFMQILLNRIIGLRRLIYIPTI